MVVFRKKKYTSDLIECFEKLYRISEDGWKSRRNSQTFAHGLYGRFPLEDAILGTWVTTTNKSFFLWDEGKNTLVELWGASRLGVGEGSFREWYPLLLAEDIENASEAMVFDLITGKRNGAATAYTTFEGKLFTTISCLTMNDADLRDADLGRASPTTRQPGHNQALPLGPD